MLCDATKGAKTQNPSIKKKGRTQTLKFFNTPINARSQSFSGIDGHQGLRLNSDPGIGRVLG